MNQRAAAIEPISFAEIFDDVLRLRLAEQEIFRQSLRDKQDQIDRLKEEVKRLSLRMTDLVPPCVRHNKERDGSPAAGSACSHRSDFKLNLIKETQK